jgi:hypothetical protein
MKQCVFVLFTCFTFSIHSFAQSKWNFTTIAEEAFFLTPESLNNPSDLISFESLASNSGLSAGFVYSYSDVIDLEGRLGVVNTYESGNFATRIVPVEFVLHYDLLSLGNFESSTKFNADVAIGSSLTSVATPTTGLNPNFNFNENIGLGASITTPLSSKSTISFGYRHTGYLSDINGKSEGIDFLSRFFTGFTINIGKDVKILTALEKAESKAKQLTSELEAKKKDNESLNNQLNLLKSTHAKEIAAISDELKALSSVSEKAETIKETQEEPVTEVSPQYFVIIGSYANKEGADEFIRETNSGFTTSYVEELKTYRVVFSKHNTLSKARTALIDAQYIVESAWIAVY